MGPLVIAAMFAGKSLLDSKNQDDQAKLNNIAEKSNARVKNIMRAADNTLKAARDNLSRYQQSLSNKYKLMSTGETRDAQATNLLRMADDMVRGGFEARIARTEEAGALAAAAGSAGVGGGSLAIIDQTSRVRFERAEQQRQMLYDQKVTDQELVMSQAFRQGILGLDNVDFNTDLNYMEARPNLTPRVDWSKAAMNAAFEGGKALMQMGGSFDMFSGGGSGIQQSVAGPGIQQSAAVSTSPFGNRPSPTLRLK